MDGKARRMAVCRIYREQVACDIEQFATKLSEEKIPTFRVALVVHEQRWPMSRSGRARLQELALSAVEGCRLKRRSIECDEEATAAVPCMRKADSSTEKIIRKAIDLLRSEEKKPI